MVTYEEFEDLARRDLARCPDGWGSTAEIEGKHPDAFFVAWATQGERMWGSDGPEERTPEPEPEIEPLLELLDDLGVRRRGVNEIKALLKRGSYRTTDDHAGSWTMRDYKYVTLDDVHAKLVELGLVEDRNHAPAP